MLARRQVAGNRGHVVMPITQRLPGAFWRFWAASTVSNLGDGVRIVALPLLAVRLTSDPLVVSGLVAMAFLPWVVVGPLSGAVVDRVDRRRLIVRVQLVRALVALAFAAAVWSGTVAVWMLYLTAFVIAVGETLVDSAAQAAVPQLVGPSQLEAANGRVMAGQIVTNDVVGAPFGALLFGIGATVPFLLDGVTYLAGALLVTLVRVDLSPVRPAGAASGQPIGLLADTAAGLRFLWSHTLLRDLAFVVALANLGMGAHSAVLVLFALVVLGVPEVGFGVLVGFGAIGGLLGAWGASRAVDRLGRRRTLLAVTVVMGGAIGGLGLATSPLVAGALLMVAMGSASAFSVVGQSLRQVLAPPHLLGRAVAGFRLVGMSAVPLGAVLAGSIARVAGLRAPFLVAGVAVLAAAALQRRVLTERSLAAALARQH
jgi:MFS family permease